MSGPRRLRALALCLAALAASASGAGADDSVATLERGNGPEPSTLDAHRCPEVACAIASNCDASGAAVAGANARLKLATSCGASSPSPFDQRSPSRSRNVQVRPSADTSHTSAMPGISRPAPSSATSPS